MIAELCIVFLHNAAQGRTFRSQDLTIVLKLTTHITSAPCEEFVKQLNDSDEYPWEGFSKALEHCVRLTQLEIDFSTTDDSWGNVKDLEEAILPKLPARLRSIASVTLQDLE